MKNTLGGINSRSGDTEESISDLKARIMKSSIRTAKRKTNLKNNVSLMGLWDNIKYINIYIIGVPRGENKDNGVENTFDEIMTQTEEGNSYSGTGSTDNSKQDESKQTHIKTYKAKDINAKKEGRG